MSEVKRYEVTEIGPTYHKRSEMLLSDEGCWVYYEDYAALKAECDALAANEGYKQAFYEIADILGIGARAASPKDVFEQVIKPMLIDLKAAEAKLAELAKQEPIACKKRLVNHRSGVAHHWTYHGEVDRPSSGDIFRVEVVLLYEGPAPAAELKPVILPDPYDDGDGNHWLCKSAVIRAIRVAGGSVEETK